MTNALKNTAWTGLKIALFLPTLAMAVSSSTLQQYVGQDVRVPVIMVAKGNFIIHSDRLKRLYSLRNFEPIWVTSSGQPTDMAVLLKEILQKAFTHGLNTNDYWDAEVENLYQAALRNPNVGVTFELAATEAVIRYASHLSGGRVDPQSIDDDIKFQKKTFEEYSQLNAALSYGASTFSRDIEGFAPQHPVYAQLQSALSTMTFNRDVWPAIQSPGFELKRGVSSPVVSKLRERFNQLGYRVNPHGGDLFDQEFENVVRRYQSLNNLVTDGKISVRSYLLDSLNESANKRIEQIQLSMEKLRWLPKNLGPRHIFVNLAAAQFKLYNGGRKIFDFKTINGQPFRRTPTMADAMTFVNLNPYWTVPRSIAIRDKLPSIKANPNYLRNNDMLLVDERTDKVVDPRSIHWASMTPAKFNYYIRQLPGRHNALGVVKFPLQNPWAIYLHDTNERGLFAERQRHRSSGCVRLEQPLEVAAYLLQDQPGWSLSEIRRYVPNDWSNHVPGELDKRVYLKEKMPVYLMYLTVDVTDEGEVRFLTDTYGQDARVSLALQNKKSSGEVF